MDGRASRVVIICLAVICLALLAMRLSRSRESSLQGKFAAQQTMPAEMFYIGSKIDKIYHNPSCKEAVRLNTKDIVTFTSARQATGKDYQPCKKCRP